VVVFWVLVGLVVGELGAAHLLKLTKNSITPPKGSQAHLANSALAISFPDNGKFSTDIIFYDVGPNRTIFDNNLTSDLSDAVTTYLRTELPHSNVMVSGYIQSMAAFPPNHFEAMEYVSEGNHSGFIVLQYLSLHTRECGVVFVQMVTHLRTIFVDSGRLDFVGDAGLAAGTAEIVKAATDSIERTDSISFCFAMVVLALSLSSARLLLLPLCGFMMSFLVSFGLSGIVARMGLITVSSATPPVMGSIILALSIDYALFLLTRFSEEIKGGSSMSTAVREMLIHSGATICGSGFTLALCFLVLLLFPVQMIQSIGVGVVISILSCMAVNLTLIPALLFECPGFFSEFACCGLRCSKRNDLRRDSISDISLSPLHGEGGSDDALRSHSSPSVVETPEIEHTRWTKWGECATTIPALIVTLVIVLGALVPISFDGKITPSRDTYLMAPRNAGSAVTGKRFSESFNSGMTGPYTLLLTPETTMYEGTFWDDAQRLIADIDQQMFVGEAGAHGSIESVLYLKGEGLNPDIQFLDIPKPFAELLDPAGPRDTGICDLMSNETFKLACEHFIADKVCEELSPLADLIPQKIQKMGFSSNDIMLLCTVYQDLLNTTVTPSRGAVAVVLSPSLSPASTESCKWYKKCLDIMQEHQDVQAYLAGPTPDVSDSIDAIYAKAPWVFGATMVLCTIMVGMLTRSVALAVMSVLLIAWTIGVTFCFGNLVYTHDLFGKKAWAPLQGTGGLAWIVPPLTFTIILGLGLDYDLFLLGRVLEYRKSGFSDRASFAYGVGKTGPVITSAGWVMAIAFGGLMLSDQPVLNQTSLLLVVAVLVDTFFIRTLATPAIHARFGKYNWWPRSVPE